MTRIPFLRLDRQTASMRSELDDAVARVLDAGRFVLGEEVERFEAAFAAWCGVQFAVGVASGTDAVTIALQAAGIEPGDEVLTAANTCVPTIVGIEQAGAVPVLLDVESDTLTLDASGLDAALTRRTKAVVPVQLYGQTADMSALEQACFDHGLLLVEDCAQAHGAAFAGRSAGSFGRAAAFSFYPTKNLGGIGDAGAVLTDDPEAAARARSLRNYGERERFTHVLRGRNSRLDALQAAVLTAKLPRLLEWNARRRRVAAVYDSALDGTAVRAPAQGLQRHHVFHLYVVRAPNRERFRRSLAAAGVETAVHYPVPVHEQPAYRSLAPETRSLEQSERAAEEVVSVPLYPELTDDEVAYVAEALAAAASA